MTDLQIGAVTCASIGGALLILFFIIFFMRRACRLQAPGWQVIMILSLALSIMLSIIASSIGVRYSLFFLFAYGFLLLLLVSFYVYSLYWSAQDNPPQGWLRELWNAQKSFGGGTFGDFANGIGLLGGVGAYKLSKADDSWFWVGLFGVFLASLVAMSLALRSNLESKAGGVHRTKARWLRWYALFNFMISGFTLIAITSPILTPGAANPDNFELVTNLPLKLCLGAWLLAMIFNLRYLGFAFEDAELPNLRYTWDERLPYILMTVMLFGMIASQIVNLFRKPYPDVMPGVFGFLALLSWSGLELVTLFEIYRDYFKRWRGVVIFLGAIPMMFLTLWVAISAPSDFEEVHWFLFSEAFVLIGMGVCLGLFVSAVNVAIAHAQEVAQNGNPCSPPQIQAHGAAQIGSQFEATSVSLKARRSSSEASTASQFEDSSVRIGRRRLSSSDSGIMAEVENPGGQPNRSQPTISGEGSGPKPPVKGKSSLVIESDSEDDDGSWEDVPL